MTKSKSFNKIPKQRALYCALMESILEDEDAMDEGVADKFKKMKQDNADKDEGPSTRSDGGLKRRKTAKTLNHLRRPREIVFEAGYTQEPHNQEQDMGNTDDQPKVKAVLKLMTWFRAGRPLTPDFDWNVRKSVNFRPPQNWISKIAQAEKPLLSFDKLMSTPIDFSAYVMNNLKIDNLTQEHLVGPTFNLLKGTCKIRVELEYNFEECSKAITNRLDWNNPEGKEYPFDLSKPLMLIMERRRQVVPADFFSNNDLDNRVSKHDVYSTKRIITVTKVKVKKWYDYGYLEEIEVRREDQQLYKFKECEFPRLHLHDIEDMLLLFVQKKLFILEREAIFDLGVALRMYTRHIVILRRVEDLHWRVKVARSSSISPSQRHSGPTSPKEVHTLHTTILKELSMKTSTRETG
ncbi:hypothetical protein Tco_1401534 [Tanacetum coccineum]